MKVKVFQKSSDPDLKCLQLSGTPFIMGCELTHDEMTVLNLPPKYAMLEDLNVDEFRYQLELTKAKMRYELKGYNPKEDDQPSISDYPIEKVNRDSESEARLPYHPVENKVTLANIRVTDFPGNARVNLPEAIHPSLEAELQIRTEQLEKEFTRYQQEQCNRRGKQRSNLSQGIKRGVEGLQEKSKNKTAIIIPTDKTGKLSAVSLEVYKQMGSVHTCKDSKITWEKATEIQKDINGHVLAWLKFTSAGESHQHEERFRMTCTSQAAAPATMYLLHKDHKQVATGEIPPSRPVVSDLTGMGVHLSNLVSTILEPIAEAIPNKIDVISTEDAMARIEEFNVMTQTTNKKYVLIGADAVSLYPSLQAASTSKAVGAEIRENCNLEFPDMDWHSMAKYVATCSQPWELRRMGVDKIVPVRSTNQGRKPTVRGKGVTLRKKSKQTIKETWVNQRDKFSAVEQKHILAPAVEIGIRTCFNKHVYTFGGEVFCQKKGGPTGKRVTCPAAKVIINRWWRKVKDIILKLGLDIGLVFVYVNDFRLGLEPIPYGWSYDKQENKWVHSTVAEQRERAELTPEAKTRQELHNIMNSVDKELRFTTESQEQYQDGHMPTLDMKIALINDTNSANQVITYTFFEKPNNSKYTTIENTAMDSDQRNQQLSMEVVRRLQRVDKRRPQSEINEIINAFTDKMTNSGYSINQTREIITSGVRYHKRKGVYKPRNMNSKKIRLNKLIKDRSDKLDWYQNKPGEDSKSTHPKEKQQYTSRIRNAKDLRKTISVLQVPKTPGGHLARKLRKREEQLRAVSTTKVKIVEKVGNTLRAVLVKSDPWGGERCQDAGCHPCKAAEDPKISCRRRSLTYVNKCKLCKTQGLNTLYLGESSNSLKERMIQHTDDFYDRSKELHMRRHLIEEHGGGTPDDFTSSVFKPHMSALSR